jgi:hypothetical protein
MGAAGPLVRHTSLRIARDVEEDWYVGSGVLLLLGHQFELVGHSAEFGKRTRLHLFHRPAAVDLHRTFGDADIARNLFVKATASDLNHDLALPRA